MPANTKHLHSICTTSAQRLRRWPNILQMLYQYFVFAGIRVADLKTRFQGYMFLYLNEVGDYYDGGFTT